MPNRRQFLQGIAGASAGTFLLRDGLMEATPQIPAGVTPTKHKPVMIGGKKIKTVDVHTHISVPEVTDFLKGTPLARNPAGGGGGGGGNPLLNAGSDRLVNMDYQGVDVQVLTINEFWYGSQDRALITRFIDFQNQKLAEMVKNGVPGRFEAFSTVAMQFPDLATKQMVDGMKMGLKGATIGGSIPGGAREITGPEYDVFWAKAEELQAPIFMHPQAAGPSTGTTERVKGIGALGVTIANPLETTLFLAHMIFDGVLERHPGLKLCSAHGGGFFGSYIDRMDHGCGVFPPQCEGSILKKKPSDYMKQTYVDSLVFTPEALRHLVNVMGATHIMIGTDNPIPWTESGNNPVQPVDHILNTPGLTDAQRIAMLSGNACKWLGIPS